MAKFAYNNAKNTSINYIPFELIAATIPESLSKKMLSLA